MDPRLSKIKKQVEFYFSDSNLPRDTFLRSKVAQDKDGYVEISLLCGFKRMKEFNATEEDFAKIFTEENGFLSLSEDKKKIHRNTPIPTVRNFNERSVYVKGFNEDTTQKFVEEFFEKICGEENISAVRRRMERKSAGGKFKGSVFVEFKTIEELEKFLQKKDEVKFEGKEMTIMKKLDFVEMKKKEIDEKKRKRKQAFYEEKVKEVLEKYKDCVLKITKIPAEKEVTFQELKDTIFIAVGGSKPFVEYPYKETDKTTAILRFDEAEHAKRVIEKANTEEGLKVKEQKVKVDMLEGEEKEAFLKNLAEVLLKDQHEPPKKKRKIN